MSNPLIAQTQDSTKAYSGISLFEDADSLAKGIESGDWASTAMGVVGTALDALSVAMDPFGAALAAGVGWLLEHVGPLKEALNGLTGNADEIKAQSETLGNVSKELTAIASDYTDAVNSDLQSWTGSASDAYRQRAQDLSTSLQAAARGCDGAASGVQKGGEIVAAVRTLVRDIIAQLIGHMISWALQVVLTLGIGLSWVVPQVVEAVAKTATQITKLVTSVVKALKALAPMLKKTGQLFEDVGKGFKGLKGGKVETPPNSKGLSGAPDAPPAKSGGASGGGTKASGYEGAPKDYTPPPGKSGADDGTHASGYEGGGGKDYTPPPGKSGADDGTHAAGFEGGGGKDYSPPPASKSGDDATHASGAGGGGKTEGGAPPPKSGDSTSGEGGGAGGGDLPPTKTPDTGSGTKTSGAGNSRGLPDKPEPPRDRAVGSDDRVCESDPVDIATGDMVMTVLDLVMPGVPELSLERTHISSYRAGRLFGATWASTLDQRLELDDENACYFSADGMILVYPLPGANEAVLPVEGPRLPLVATETGYRLADPAGQVDLEFAAVEGSRPGVFPLVAIEHTGGDRIDFEYGPSGVPAGLTRSDGRAVRLLSEQGRITGLDVVDAAGDTSVTVARFGYNRLGQLTNASNSSGLAAGYDYDVHGRMVGWQDRTGTWYRYVYDADGRCVRTVGPQGYFSGAFAYDRERLITRYSDSLGNVTEYHLNAANQMLRRIDPLGNVTGYVWDRYDRLLERVDPLGRTTAYSYDADGELMSVTRPDGSVVEVVGDDTELTITVRDENRYWSRAYSGDNVPDPLADPLGVSTALSYTEVIDRQNARPAVATTSTGATAAADTRDVFGRATTVLNRSRRQVRLGWTVEGEENLRVHPSGIREARRYDAEGNEVEHVNGAGFTSRTEYGPFGLRTASVDASGARTTYVHDTELRLTTVTNPLGLQWSYRHDAAGRLVEEVDFDGRVLRFDYDRAGQLVRSVNGAGEVTEYVYDRLGNVLERRTPTGTTRYAYDPVGRMVHAAIGDVELQVEYAPDGTLLSETVDGRTVTTTRDENGTTVRRTPSGAESVWSFDAAGNPDAVTVGGHSVRFRHDETGREVVRTIDGRVVVSHAFDNDENLVAQSVRTGETERSRRFSYRRDGFLTGIDDEVAGPTHLVLDAVGRVVELRTPQGSRQYRYDGLGNVVESGEPVAGAATGAHRYARNTLVGAGATAYEHDLQGRVVLRREGDRAWRYTWDAHDRLIGLLTPEGDRWTYRYDPVGRRIGKQRLVPAAGSWRVAETFEFSWSGAQLVEQCHVGESGTRTVTTWEYHPEDDRPILQVGQPSTVDEQFFSIVTDLLGTPTELLDADGATVWRDSGGLWDRAGSATLTPLRFPGQYADSESGLHYNVYRYYDPATGRYLSQDPLGLGPAENPVAYVPNPFADCDPLGLAPTKGKKGACGGGGGGASDRPGASNDASNVPDKKGNKGKGKDTGTSASSSGGKSGNGKLSADKESYNLGDHNGVDVNVDSHQAKHQQGGNSFLGMNPYKGGSGTKFPSNVDESWHQNHMAPKVSDMTKEKTDPIDQRLEDKRADIDERKAQAEHDAKAHAIEERDKLKAQVQADKKAGKDVDVQQVKAKNEALAAERDEKIRKANEDLEKEYQEAVDARNNTVINDYKKVPQDDGIIYDIATTYDPVKGKWTSTYHGNPPDETWWKVHGKNIAKNNPKLTQQ
ncbi:RHS repeat-associated core domain-containing protein [Amycolatopsis rhabdoformis]|uniref:RHS repeat-associated core domain-containing protein n=1 Tax=Amycolatopsis rhabdoformis TaxID=1448059 RepID=A0ABZ1IHL8_9PSEU|nr:RHS repeat-associated core domain-containing protein [Amycolatopsis rhabdoformis]WSE33437.1 RHS repeat-associated core domain-containing protein [Amycolatopsis rhabdoformis]